MLHHVCCGSLRPTLRVLLVQEDATTIFVPLPLSDVFPGTWSMDASGEAVAVHAACQLFAAANLCRLPLWPLLRVQARSHRPGSRGAASSPSGGHRHSSFFVTAALVWQSTLRCSGIPLASTQDPRPVLAAAGGPRAQTRPRCWPPSLAVWSRGHL